MNDDLEVPMDEDNIEAAMDKVAETLETTRVPAGSSKAGDPASKQVLMRASERDHGRWKEAADKLNISMAEFMRNACNEAAGALLGICAAGPVSAGAGAVTAAPSSTLPVLAGRALPK